MMRLSFFDDNARNNNFLGYGQDVKHLKATCTSCGPYVSKVRDLHIQEAETFVLWVGRVCYGSWLEAMHGDGVIAPFVASALCRWFESWFIREVIYQIKMTLVLIKMTVNQRDGFFYGIKRFSTNLLA
jgi:hypothetical protein